MMPRHWYVRQRASLPRFDLIEAFKTCFIWFIGAIYFCLLGFIIVGFIWLWASSKGAI